jgi:uncharacterized protein
MRPKALVDAGPIVAYLRADDEFHDWAVLQFGRFPKLTTCEAVLAEACARLAYYRLDQSKVLALLSRGSLEIGFEITPHAERISRLMLKYRNRPMDLADACLVAMTERFSECLVITLDASDFRVYRRHEREVVPYVCPPPRRRRGSLGTPGKLLERPTSTVPLRSPLA